LRNPIFPKKSDFLGTLGGLRNPIFPKKSDFLGTLGGLRNPIFPKNRISWALSGWSGNFCFLALA
jgi:hypothetical protein